MRQIVEMAAIQEVADHASRVNETFAMHSKKSLNASKANTFKSEENQTNGDQH